MAKDGKMVIEYHDEDVLVSAIFLHIQIIFCVILMPVDFTSIQALLLYRTQFLMQF